MALIMPQIIVLSAISRMVLEIKRKTKKFLFLKKTMKGHLGIPKKYVEEIADYNGLRYLSTFEWE